MGKVPVHSRQCHNGSKEGVSNNRQGKLTITTTPKNFFLLSASGPIQFPFPVCKFPPVIRYNNTGDWFDWV